MGKGPYKNVDCSESSTNMSKKGGITTSAYSSLKGKDSGTAKKEAADGKVASGMSGSGGATSDAIKNLTKHAKSCTPSRESSPEGTVAKP